MASRLSLDTIVSACGSHFVGRSDGVFSLDDLPDVCLCHHELGWMENGVEVMSIRDAITRVDVVANEGVRFLVEVAFYLVLRKTGVFNYFITD